MDEKSGRIKPTPLQILRKYFADATLYAHTQAIKAVNVLKKAGWLENQQERNGKEGVWFLRLPEHYTRLWVEADRLFDQFGPEGASRLIAALQERMHRSV